MNENTQNKAREEIIAHYEKKAFEALALYSYWGNRYSAIEKELERVDATIKDIEVKLLELKGSKAEDRKTTRHALQKDLNDYNARLEGIKKLGQDLFKKATSFREEGVTILEQIEFVREFKMKTPEQIEADKVATAPAQA